MLSFSSSPSGTGIAAFLAILYSTEHAVMTSKFVDSLNLSCCRKQGKRLFHIPNTKYLHTCITKCIIEMALLPCRACQEWCNQIRSEWISVINILIYLEFPFFPDGHKCYCFQNPTVVSTSRPSCYNIC